MADPAPATPLDPLDRCRRARLRYAAIAGERDAAIRAARAAGHPLRTIADAVGLSHSRVAQIVDELEQEVTT